MQVKEFKCRASAIGQIMTNPRSKSELLSQTAKTYCETWLKEQIYGRRKEIYNKYLQKGLDMENEAIALVENHYNYDFLIKNEKNFANDFLIGTPDLILPDCIRDTKCSWDCFTFPLFETTLDKGYYWQMQGYMALVGRDVAYVDYVLVDTPEELDSNAESYRMIDVDYRVKSFKVERNDADINAITERVKLCRDYINNLI